MLEEVFFLLGEEAHVDEHAHELGEALVPERAPDDGLGVGDGVLFAVLGAVAVGVGDESVAGVDEVWSRGAHEFRAGDLDLLSVFVEFGRVAEGEEGAAGGPREFVSQRVVGGFGSS